MSADTKKVTALSVAEYFIDRANKEKKTITNKKLQKLLYYAQVWSLVLNKEKLFPERIEAWVHGPAVPIVYRRFKSFEFNPIQIDTSSASFDFSKRQSDLLDSIWSVYGKYNAEYLEALTHSELPWQEARKDISVSESSSNIISLTTAQKFYAGKLKTKTSN
ncbi:MAG: DUF4065 domain-containing protein [Candidatus Woesearchaeota archaeon]|nr:DUF4065 domain-containing protein [Candidatus Woesearchaeota archaeon]